MKPNSFPSAFALLGSLLCVVSVANAKPPIRSEADLPRFSYPLSGPASTLLEADDATFATFASKVQKDVDTVLDTYDIQNKSALRLLLGEKAELQELGGDARGALATTAALNALEEKPDMKLAGEIFADARLQAALEAHAMSGPAYQQAFVRHYRASIDPLPWDIVRDAVRGQYSSTRLRTRGLVLGIVRLEIDPAASKSGAVDDKEAADLITARTTLRLALPLADARSKVLLSYISAHNVAKPDIWAAREVTLKENQHLKPVLVGIWDSGIDLNDFPGQVFDDPKPTVSGIHGLAFDDEGHASTNWLHPLTPQQLAGYPQAREATTGIADLKEGIDSPAADATVKMVNTLSVDQLQQLYTELNDISHYIHGTHCAGIAVRGNPAARLVVARFNDELPFMTFPPTMEWVHRMGADFQQMADYFRTRKVRVVNVSWGDEATEFEEWLSKTGGGADPTERKRKAAELFMGWRAAIAAAMRSAPGTLFVVAAGNSDSNPDFTEDIPASLALPNIIVVGAVNQAGDATSFTSYGKTVVVDADGYNVESNVPGGARLKLSGTSMAAPNVVNLAAKLFALDPDLTPTEAIALIRKGASVSADGRLHLIDEVHSVALLPAGHAN